MLKRKEREKDPPCLGCATARFWAPVSTRRSKDGENKKTREGVIEKEKKKGVGHDCTLLPSLYLCTAMTITRCYVGGRAKSMEEEKEKKERLSVYHFLGNCESTGLAMG